MLIRLAARLCLLGMMALAGCSYFPGKPDIKGLIDDPAVIADCLCSEQQARALVTDPAKRAAFDAVSAHYNAQCLGHVYDGDALAEARGKLSCPVPAGQ